MTQEPGAKRDADHLPVGDAQPGREPRRNPRFRRGSRGAGAPAASPERRAEPPAASSPAEEPAAAGPVTYNRAVRGRRGRRGGGGGPGEPGGRAQPDAQAADRPPSREQERTPERAGEDVGVPVAPIRPPQPALQEPAPPAVEAGSLFKRMSAALQRAMLGSPPKDEPDEH